MHAGPLPVRPRRAAWTLPELDPSHGPEASRPVPDLTMGSFSGAGGGLVVLPARGEACEQHVELLLGAEQ
jgi:hypothetical protein